VRSFNRFGGTIPLDLKLVGRVRLGAFEKKKEVQNARGEVEKGGFKGPWGGSAGHAARATLLSGPAILDGGHSTVGSSQEG